jgi:phenylacetyl-CoA:acceptor oxidoreductase subunit 2
MILFHALPAVFAAAAALGVPYAGACLMIAGLSSIAGGWLLKYTLVTRAAFTQGFALAHLPVRGRGVAGPAVKPGWASVG